MRRPIDVVRVSFRGGTAIVHESHRDEGLSCRQRRGVVEFGVAFAVGGGHRDPAALHAREEQRRRARHLDHHVAALELLRLVAHEARPARSAGNQVAQRAHHLAAVAHAEAEDVGARKECGERVAYRGVETDGLGPALAGAQHVAVGKAAAADEALEVGEREATRRKVAHVHVVRVEARAVERGGHLDLPVDTLLAQDGNLGTNPRRDIRRGHIDIRVERESRRHSGIAAVLDA